jgi:hypothetical protein
VNLLSFFHEVVVNSGQISMLPHPTWRASMNNL